MSKLVTSDNLKAYHGELAEHLQLLERDKVYLVGDIAKYDGLTLKCTIAGNTDVNKVDYSSIDVGDTIVDGTVTFTVIDPNSMWYEENKFYMVDDIVVYDDKFYKCITAHTATAIFDTTKWAELSTGGGVDLPEWQANTSYTAGKYLVHEGTVYKVTTNFTSGTTFDDTNLSAYIAPVMTGATSSNDGKSGIVPTPTTNDVEKFLKGDGTWTGLDATGLFVSRDTIYTSTTAQSNNDELTMSKPYTDYDMLILYVGETNGVIATNVVNPQKGDTDVMFGYYRSASNFYSATLHFSTSTTATINYISTAGYGASNFLRRIEGIKFIPSNNVYTSKNLLWSGTHLDIASVNSITLADDVTDYDVIVMNAVGGAASCYAFVDTSVGAVTLAAEELINDPTGKIQIAGYILFSSPNILNFLIKNYGTNYTSSNPAAIRVWGLKFTPNPNDYSTTERRIGTWIDGKPLYQVTLSGTTDSSTNTTTRYNELPYNDLTPYNIDTVVDITGGCYSTNYSFTPFCSFQLSYSSQFNEDNRAVLNVYTAEDTSDNNKLKLWITSGNWYAGLNYVATIKYTKV